MHPASMLVCALLLASAQSMAAAQPPAGAKDAPPPGASAVPETPPSPLGGRSISQSAELGMSAEDMFKEFTTAEGLVRALGVAKAKVDFRLGGQWRASYKPETDLDSAKAIVNTILAFEPGRMITIKPTAPEGAPPFLRRICSTGWNVIRFEPLGARRCRLTVTSLGYGDGPEYDQAYQFFKAGNQSTLDHMAKTYPLAEQVRAGGGEDGAGAGVIEVSRFVAAGPVPVDIHKEAVVDASPGEVFRAWTTGEGIKSFLGIDSRVELRVGGPMELYFGPGNPPGERGSDGSQILGYLPDRMLCFSWNAPPSFPEERAKRSWVVMTFEPVAGGRTRVELNHLGFGPHGQGRWDEVRAYLERGWTHAFEAMEKSFSSGDRAGSSTEPVSKQPGR